MLAIQMRGPFLPRLKPLPDFSDSPTGFSAMSDILISHLGQFKLIDIRSRLSVHDDYITIRADPGKSDTTGTFGVTAGKTSYLHQDPGFDRPQTTARSFMKRPAVPTYKPAASDLILPKVLNGSSPL